MLICTAAGAVGVPLGSVLGERCGVGSDAVASDGFATTQSVSLREILSILRVSDLSFVMANS
jgi:hypothetical protein